MDTSRVAGIIIYCGMVIPCRVHLHYLPFCPVGHSNTISLYRIIPVLVSVLSPFGVTDDLLRQC